MAVARFWREQQSRYNLIGCHCETCGEYYYPPRPICPKCRRGGKMETYKFKGTGQIVTYTVTHTTSDDFNDLTPYVVAIVQLDEGPRLTTQIVDEPHNVDFGNRVHAVFRKLGAEGPDGVIHYGTKFAMDDE